MADYRWVVLLCWCVLPACRRDEAAPSGSDPPALIASSARLPVPTRSSAVEELDQLDTRRPVPLLALMAHHQKQSMRDHLRAVQEVVAAMASEDFAAATQAAERLGSSNRMTQMCSHMGAASDGFTEQALAFHRAADAIGRAAREHDRAKMLDALGSTLGACNGCHETWKQSPVDAEAWRTLTTDSRAAPHPANAH